MLCTKLVKNYVFLILIKLYCSEQSCINENKLVYLHFFLKIRLGPIQLFTYIIFYFNSRK